MPASGMVAEDTIVFRYITCELVVGFFLLS